MFDADKLDWLTIAIYLSGIGLAYELHDQGIAVTQAAFLGIVLGQRLMAIRLRNQSSENGPVSVRQGIRMPSLWRRRLGGPMDEKMRAQVTVLLFASVMGLAAGRSAIFGGASWGTWVFLLLFLATGAFSLVLLSRDIWKPKSRSGDGWA